MRTEPLPGFGGLLKSTRRSRRMGQADLAESAGLRSREAIRLYERGKMLPSNKTLEGLLDALSVPSGGRDAFRLLLQKERAELAAKKNRDCFTSPMAQIDNANITGEQLSELVDYFFEFTAQPRDVATEASVLRNVLGILKTSEGNK